MESIWIIEEDGTHTPGKLINPVSPWPRTCTVQADPGYVELAGVDGCVRLWSARNVLNAKGLRLG